MTVRLDAYELKAVINGLFQTRAAFGEERQDAATFSFVEVVSEIFPARTWPKR